MRQAFKLLTPLFKLLLPLYIVCSALLAGCGASLPAVKPFKMDIQQGNVVTSKMLLQLKPGMTKSQVRFIMGTPLLVDSFHKDRWDYFYQLRQAGKIVEQRRVILDFDKELLTRVRGDVVPQVKSGADTGDSHVVSAPITVEPKPKEESMLDKLKFWKKDGKVDAQPAIAATIATEAKEEVVKPETKSKAEEKSLLDKLKFRKKDELVVAPEKVAPASPSVVLPAEAAAVVIPESSETAKPSLLVVPVELPPAEATKEKPDMVGPTQTEPLETEPVVPAKAIPAPEKVAPKSHDSPPAKELTAKPELKKPLSMTAKQGDPLIFRMDRSLNLHRPDEVKPAALAPTASTPEVNKSKAIKTDSAPLPDEAEPSYFDKLLEKIGF